MSISERQAVAYVDGQPPQLELNAQEWVFPFRQADDDRRPAYFHMSPYRSEELKRWYDKLIVRYRQRSQNERVVELPQVPEVKEFLEKHFIKLSNVELEDGNEPSEEEKAEWWKQADALKQTIFRKCYDAVRPDASMSNGNGRMSLKSVLMFSKPYHEILTQTRLYSPEKRQEEKVLVRHVLDKLNPGEAHRYDKAVSVVENTRNGEQYFEGNWDVVENLYDIKVKRLEGALVNGKACSAENKDEWTNLVPFPMKVYVMGQLDNEAKLKNA